ncbi:MAG: TlyA family RNA methyltransferase [Jatrophihabitans sp.]
MAATNVSPAPVRLDIELVRRGLARSRTHAAQLIHEGRVRRGGKAAGKPSALVEESDLIEVAAVDAEEWVSRGGYKLAGALEAMASLAVAGRRCLDAGSSTGGFTDVLLRRGAREVVAVDVGTDQLVDQLAADPRVVVREQLSVRDLAASDIGGPVDLVVADLSFISLVKVLPNLVACARADGDLLLMIKPQFEVGKECLGRGGVVRDPALQSAAVTQVVTAAFDLGWGTAGIVRSVLPGPAGNVEFFAWLHRDAPAADPAAIAAVAEAPAPDDE